MLSVMSLLKTSLVWVNSISSNYEMYKEWINIFLLAIIISYINLLDIIIFYGKISSYTQRIRSTQGNFLFQIFLSAIIDWFSICILFQFLYSKNRCGTIASRHLVGRWSRDYHMCRLVFLCFFPRPRCFQIRGKRRWMRSSRWRLEFVLERRKVAKQILKNDENKARVFHTSVSWWSSTGVWVSESLLKSPWLLSVFCLILIIP